MIDREKVKNALKLCASGCDEDGCIYIDEHYDLAKGRCIDFLAADALELIEELEERVAIMEEGCKAQKFFVDEDGKITPLPIVFPNRPMNDLVEVVRCKDCKHRTRRICNNIEFWECNHLRYEIAKCGVTDDWFCADGERK